MVKIRPEINPRIIEGATDLGVLVKWSSMQCCEVQRKLRLLRIWSWRTECLSSQTSRRLRKFHRLAMSWPSDVFHGMATSGTKSPRALRICVARSTSCIWPPSADWGVWSELRHGRMNAPKGGRTCWQGGRGQKITYHLKQRSEIMLWKNSTFVWRFRNHRNCHNTIMDYIGMNICRIKTRLIQTLCPSLLA